MGSAAPHAVSTLTGTPRGSKKRYKTMTKLFTAICFEKLTSVERKYSYYGRQTHIFLSFTYIVQGNKRNSFEKLA
jgi:hypothetical protein